MRRGAPRARPGLAGEALRRLLVGVLDLLHRVLLRLSGLCVRRLLLVLRWHLLVLLRLLRGMLVLRRSLRGLCVRSLLLPVELLRRDRLVRGRVLGRGRLLGMLGLRGLLPSLLLPGLLPARGLLRGGGLLLPGYPVLSGVAAGSRVGVGPGGHGRAGEVQPRPVGGVSEVNGRTRADLQVLDALALRVGAVGAAVVLDGPTAPVPVHGGVPPRDPGVLQHHVALRIAPEAIRPGRVQRPGPSIQFQYDFRHSMPQLLVPRVTPCGRESRDGEHREELFQARSPHGKSGLATAL
ncbi:hypothetical protein GCM10023324_61740 [Streptomyces youssoufiensis]